MRFVVDGNAIQLGNIANAIQLMEQFMPPAAEIAAVEIRETGDVGQVIVRRGETLDFRADGNGALGLIQGWSEPEEWGTWSVSKLARVRLSVVSPDTAPIHADLKYQAFVHARHPRLDIVCRVEGHDVAAWSCTTAAPGGIQRLTIPATLVAADGTIELEFSISEPRSPAELGVNSDHRLLGIGVETLRLLA